MTKFCKCLYRYVALLSACVAIVAAMLGPISAQEPEGSWGPDLWQPGWLQRYMWGAPDAKPEVLARMRRHHAYVHEGVPADYRGARSTLGLTKENITEGSMLYAKHCVSCHGKGGLGDGDAAKGLSPSPALLIFMIDRPVAVDEYLLWTISEGGKEFATEMPAFKDVLSKEETWKIVTYMRAGFPEVRDSE